MGDKDKKYTVKDAAKDTKSSNRDVSRAWHQARDEAQNSDHPYDKWLTEKWKREDE